jgi:hypothetical protein
MAELVVDIRKARLAISYNTGGKRLERDLKSMLVHYRWLYREINARGGTPAHLGALIE